jgi:MFS family permease
MSNLTSPAKTERHTTLVVLIVCLAQFMVILDATITLVAIPSIQTDLHFAPGDLQWVINAYLLTFGGFLLLGGRAGDLFGRRRLFLLGVGLFTAASLADALATSPAMLVAARAVQGLGAALVSPAALSIITTTVPEGPERTRALGVFAAITGGGGAAGLLLGGILTDALSWQWVFLVNLPVGIAAIALALRFVPESRSGEHQRGFDLAGAVLVTAALSLLTFTIVKAQDYGWGSARTLAGAAGTLALLAAFVAVERRRSCGLRSSAAGR